MYSGSVTIAHYVLMTFCRDKVSSGSSYRWTGPITVHRNFNFIKFLFTMVKPS